MKSTRYFILILLAFYITSCTSVKDVVYFQDKKSVKVEPEVNNPCKSVPSHIIAVGDYISLNINTPLQTSGQILSQKEGTSGTQVKGDSTIEIPILGNIKIAGLSLSIAKDTILQRAKIYFNQPYVNLQLLSYRVTMVGEVNAPGIKSILTENGTLLDGIAIAGDLTNFGNRKNIKVLRGDQIFYLDITNISVFKSEGFYLQSNDVVYVEPLKKKNILSNLSTSLTVTGFAAILVSLTNTIILLTK